MQDLTPFRSVVDVGCGRGAWLSVFEEYGAETIVGYDGEYIDRSRLLIPTECFRSAELTKPLAVKENFDLAVCLEVGEHLPPNAASRLVNVLTACAPMVLFSAAIPGQRGTRHINEQWPQYWQRLFADHGFVRLDPIRPLIWRDLSVAWYYKQNIFLYAHHDRIKSNPVLEQERTIAEASHYELIHSDVLSQYTSLRGVLASIPGAIRRAFTRRLFS